MVHRGDEGVELGELLICGLPGLPDTLGKHFSLSTGIPTPDTCGPCDLGHEGLEVHNDGLQGWGLLFHLGQQRLPEVVEVKDNAVVAHIREGGGERAA